MKIYNSLTHKKEELIPLEKNEISMYVCGITPYDTTHLGHAYVYNFFDVLKRYLTYKNYSVTYTQNVTDIDDDTLARAKRDNTDWKKLGEFWTEKFLTDLKHLNIALPDHYVKATDSIPTIIEIVKTLIKKGFAYEKDGTVYFSIQQYPKYGSLSKLTESEMITLSRERGANPDDPAKRHPLDFILWQKMQPGEPFWESTWGKGRPGWHIECSAMIYDTLGSQIDIHGGGGDLIFPHHESEIAQSESFTEKKPFVKNWMHVGMLRYQGEKMSKSLGNLILVSDLLKTYSPGAIRWMLLSHHYRDEWEFKEQDIIKAEKEFGSVKQFISKPLSNQGNKLVEQIEKLMDDDFNTPKVLSRILSDKSDKITLLLKILGFT